MSKFKVGDKVAWSSQASGYKAEKTGVVVGVVPAGGRKWMWEYIDGMRCHVDLGDTYALGRMYLYDSPRNHESYMVAVKVGATDRAKKALYRPRVSGLKRVNV